MAHRSLTWSVLRGTCSWEAHDGRRRLADAVHTRKRSFSCTKTPGISPAPDRAEVLKHVINRTKPATCAHAIAFRTDFSRRYASTLERSPRPPHLPPPPRADPWEEGGRIVSELATEIRASVRAYTQQLAGGAPCRQIKLVGITTSGGSNRATIDADAEVYSDHISATFAEDGIMYELWRVPTDPEKIEQAIYRAEEIPGVHGVLIFFPIFREVTPQRLAKLVMYTGGGGGGGGAALPGRAAEVAAGPVTPFLPWGGEGEGLYRNRRTGARYRTFDDYFRDMIPPTLDVEGLCHDYNARSMGEQASGYIDRGAGAGEEEEDTDGGRVVFPCTSLAVARILDACRQPGHNSSIVGSRLSGYTVTIVNRSEIFGRPLATMLANDGAHVYSADVESILRVERGGRTVRCEPSEIDLEGCVRRSSVLVTAVPDLSFQIDVDWIQPHSTVINVAREDNIDEVALLEANIEGLTYIPQVGQVTTALLAHNLVLLHKRYHAKSE